MIYLDTSAFLKLYIREAHSQPVQETIVAQNDPLPVWDLLQAEMCNAFALKVFWRELDSSESERLLSAFERRLRSGQYWIPEIDRTRLLVDFMRLTSLTHEIGCRTLDLMHVACAVQLEPSLFLTFDDRQRETAVRAGLSVQ